MIKKILVAVLCGILAVGMTACASGNAVLDQVQNVLEENNVDVNGIINNVLDSYLNNGANSGSNSGQAQTEKPSATEETTIEETTTEKETAVEETTVEEKTTEETTVEERTTEEETTVEERTTEEETTVEERTTEEETTADERTTEEETTARETIDREKEESKFIVLDGDKGTIDKADLGSSRRDAVFVSHDIVYYQDIDKYDSGNYYGDGDREDRHTEEEADENAVLNITEPGTYTISGTWEGQIRVDLGEDAKTDKEAKVVLILDNADIGCSVAPAILFENVYECDVEGGEDTTVAAGIEEETTSSFGSRTEEETTTSSFGSRTEEETTASLFGNRTEEETTASLFGSRTEEETTASLFGNRTEEETTASLFGNRTEDETTVDERETLISGNGNFRPERPQNEMPGNGMPTANATFKDVDTTDAGAVIYLAKGSVNKIGGSHVAEIYKDSKTTEKEVKQDGAIYSYMSMSIESADDEAMLNVYADKEGIDTERHLTINGGSINVVASEDGINTNADNVSITKINGGNVYVSGGMTDTGDGIDSNGWIVINGGNVVVSAAPESDSGLDSDLGTIINGGEVISFGSDMSWADRASTAVTMNIQFKDKVKSTDKIEITDLNGKEVFSYDPKDAVITLLTDTDRDYTGLVISSSKLEKGESYYLYVGGVQQAYSGTMGESEGFDRPGFGTGADHGFGPGNDRPEDSFYDDLYDQYNLDDSHDGYNDSYDHGYGYDQEFYNDIYESFYDDWYEDWFANEFEDLFEDHGISMDEVEDYIETRKISFLPDHVFNTSKKTGEGNDLLIDTKEETTEETKENAAASERPQGNDLYERTDRQETKPESANVASEVFELKDTVNFFASVGAFEETAVSSTETENTFSGTERPAFETETTASETETTASERETTASETKDDTVDQNNEDIVRPLSGRIGIRKIF